MPFVNSLVFRDSSGEEYDEEDIDQMWKMEDFLVNIDCPVCSHTYEFTKDAPFKHSHAISCPNCSEGYFLHPINDPDGSLLKKKTAREKMEIQLNSVNKVYDIVEKKPELTTQMSHTPKIAVLGVMSIFFGFLTLPAYLIKLSHLIPSNMIVNIAFFFYTMAMLLGTISLFDGPLGIVYYNYLLYREQDVDFSFYRYAYHIGNYYHGQPYFIIG